MNKKIITTICLVFTLALAGCQNGTRNKDVDPRLQQNDDIEFFSKSGMTACAAGAAAGALACLAVSSDNRGVCMIAAAVAGCGIGIGTNAYLDNQRKKYANKEQQLNAMISDIQQENKRLQSASSTAKSVIADDKRALAKISEDISQKRLHAPAPPLTTPAMPTPISTTTSRKMKTSTMRNTLPTKSSFPATSL